MLAFLSGKDVFVSHFLYQQDMINYSWHFANCFIPKAYAFLKFIKSLQVNLIAMSSKRDVPYCVGKWLPSDQAVINSWLKKLTQKVLSGKQDDVSAEVDASDEDKGLEIPNLHPAVKELKELIENDSKVNMFFHQMFTQVPFNVDPTGQPQVRNYREMLRLIGHNDNSSRIQQNRAGWVSNQCHFELVNGNN